MQNPRRLIGIVVALLLVAAAGFTGYKKVKSLNDKKKADSVAAATGKVASPPRPDSAPALFGAGAAIPVVGAEVIKGPLIIWVKALAQAVASTQVMVTPRTNGDVAKVYVRENDIVRAGDTLIVLDTTELVFALRQAQNGLKSAQTQYQNALLSDHRVTDPEIRKQREAAARISSGLENATLALSRAELEFGKATTLAPMSGRVANLKVVPGQRVGGAEIMTIVAIDPIRIEAQVLQSEIGKIQRGNLVRLRFAAYSDTQYTGTVESINPVVDQGRTSRVTITMRNPRAQILPGMSADVEIQSQTFQNRLLVDRRSVLQRSEGRDMLLVYMPGRDGGEGWADWRYVNVGLRNSEYIEILPGTDGSQKLVEPGEIVLVDGHYTIAHQTPVKLVDKLGGKIDRPF